MPQQLILALTMLAAGAVAFVGLQMKNPAIAIAALVVVFAALVVLITQTRRIQRIESKIALYNALLGAKMQQGFERDDPIVHAAVNELPELQKQVERFKGKAQRQGKILAVYHHERKPDAQEIARREAIEAEHARKASLDDLYGEAPSGIVRAWHYDPATRTLEATAWAEAGSALDAQESAYIRQMLHKKQTAEGHPVDEIRVVFMNREQAQPHHAALRELGCRVFHHGQTPQDLVEMA